MRVSRTGTLKLIKRVDVETPTFTLHCCLLTEASASIHLSIRYADDLKALRIRLQRAYSRALDGGIGALLLFPPFPNVLIGDEAFASFVTRTLVSVQSLLGFKF